MWRGFAARRSIRCALAAASIALVAFNPVPSYAQSDVVSTTEDVASVPEDSDVTISDVQITGNQTVTKKQIRAELDTRAGENLDTFKLQRDVRNLTKMDGIFDVKVKTKPSAETNSVVVIFEIFEFPKLEHLYFIGNKEMSDRVLNRKSELKVNDPLNIVAVEEARRKILAFYHEKGFNKAQIEIKEGTKRSDRGAVFLVSEGPQQRIWSVKFVGNTIVSGSRLKTQIESKPSMIKYVSAFAGGYVDRRQIDEDINRLTSYYRSLGYMVARVSRSMEYRNNDRWLNLTFVIDEGPRFTVRDVSFEGNDLFDSEQLHQLLKLKKGDYFDLSTMSKDVANLTDAYGALGFILADIRPSPRTLENTPEIDLVYDITRGDRYEVGRINVMIQGENPHTQRTVALNRIDLHPGDIVDIRKIHDSERRLRASGLFKNDVERGVKPRIVFSPAEKRATVAEGKKDRRFRGQSPEPSKKTVTVPKIYKRQTGPSTTSGGALR